MVILITLFLFSDLIVSVYVLPLEIFSLGIKFNVPPVVVSICIFNFLKKKAVKN
jgi:hypothetical protein